MEGWIFMYLSFTQGQLETSWGLTTVYVKKNMIFLCIGNKIFPFDLYGSPVQFKEPRKFLIYFELML